MALSRALTLTLLAPLAACEGGEEPPFGLYVGGATPPPQAGALGAPPPPPPAPLRDDCGPLLPATLALYNEAARTAPGAVLAAVCSTCHDATPDPGNDLALPGVVLNTPLSPEAMVAVYGALAPFLTPGDGDASVLTLRLYDGHFQGSVYTAESPEVLAMAAWITSLVPCP